MTTNDKFTIYCSECKREVEPITYFNGELYCPYCRTRFVDKIGKKAHSVPDPREINKEDMAISQQYFIRYLMDIVPKMRECIEEDDSKSFDEYVSIRTEYLRQAIDYCKRAAYNGNPNALLNLAYYYKSGYAPNILNREIAAEKLYNLAQDLYGANSDFDDEIKLSVAQKLRDMDKNSPVAQRGNGYSYFCNIVNDSGNQRFERTPLFGIVSIHFHELSGTEQEELLNSLRRAAKDWSSNKYCGLYYFDGYEFKALHGGTVEINIDESIFASRDITHLVYRNVNYEVTNKPCAKSAKEIVTAKEINRDFFAKLFKLKQIDKEDCTISFCDWDAYICKDSGSKGKFDDLVAEVKTIWNL